MIDINYGQLFSVELLHKYAGDQLCNDFAIVPSLHTQQTLNNYHIVARQYGNVLYAGVDLDPAFLALHPAVKKPLVVPKEGLQLTFFLLLNNPLFFNYTSIRKVNNNGNVYYFTNRNDNISSNKNFLSSVLANYAGGTTYAYEDIVVDGGISYQSVHENNLGNSLNDNNFWRKADLDPAHLNRFISDADLLSWRPSVSRFNLSSATSVIDVQVTGYDGTGNYTQPVRTATIENRGMLPSFTLDLSGIESGKYLLSVNGATPIPVYLNDELSNKRIFGVIDIFIESSLPAGYEILAPSGELISPVPLYSIYFLNRATIWKYILTRNSDTEITEPTNFYTFITHQPADPAKPTTILSQFPIPLSETPLTLKLDGQDKPRPPCPGGERLTIVDPDPVYFSEIFLNY